tara:strand:- start:32 stop:385 length:354 start_codon:yes stop_codon:yes gene_type:complete
MEKIKIFHNKRCSKSREALALVREITEDIEIIDYMNSPIDKLELVQVINELGIAPQALLRKGEADYKEHFKGKDLSEDQVIDLMLAYPKLIERPIVITNGRAIVARPPELVNDFIGS